MEEFLLTKEPLNIVRISTALYIRVEQGEWTGVLEKEVENFMNILKKVLKQIPLDGRAKKETSKFWYWEKTSETGIVMNYFYDKYMDMMTCIFRFSDMYILVNTLCSL